MISLEIRQKNVWAKKWALAFAARVGAVGVDDRGALQLDREAGGLTLGYVVDGVVDSANRDNGVAANLGETGVGSALAIVQRDKAAFTYEVTDVAIVLATRLDGLAT